MPENDVLFYKFPIDEERYGPAIITVYILNRKGRKSVIDAFERLPRKNVSQLKALISKIAIVKKLASNHVRWTLVGYDFGEIKIEENRIFFFKQYESNLLLFEYRKKKTKKLNPKVYKEIEQKKKEIEDEFKKFIDGIG